MSTNVVKNVKIPEELQKLASFHGHLGPYVVIGHRMALISNRTQGLDLTKKHVIVRTGTKPPISCIIDGIQFTSGCTVGRGKMEVTDEGLPEATFISDGNKLTISLKHSFFVNPDETEKLALEIFQMSDEKLFKLLQEG